jgi:Tfp pilus assembly protein PilF
MSAKNHAAANDQRWQAMWVCLALAAITFAVFGQTAHHDFINFDDNDYVYANPVVAQGLTFKGLVWAFSGAHAENWHPLTWLSHMLDCQLYGLRPAGHHVSSVIFHAATVIALFLVLRQMTGAFWRSAFVAAVFAIHPLRVESVAWVSERKDVLSGLFFMLTIAAYVRYARLPWSPARYGLVVLLFAMGLMCKPMLVTLPVVLLLLDYWPLRRMESQKFSRLLLEKLPLLALSAGSCLVTLLEQTKLTLPTGSSLPLGMRLVNAVVSCAVYLGQMVYPAKLALFYPYPFKGFPGWEVALAALLAAALSLIAIWQWKKQPWLLVGWLWYLVMLTPVLGIIQVGGQAHADRYTYLPQIGIYVAVTWLVAGWVAKWRIPRMAVGWIMAGIVGLLMVCAWKQTACWQNSETIWSHTIACTQDNDVAHLNLGLVFLQNGNVDGAIAEYQNALQINPNVAEAHYNLGVAFLQTGKVDDALNQFQAALKINPAFAAASVTLGEVYFQQGRLDAAIPQFQKALQINADNVQAQMDIANALMQKGEVDEGILHFQKVLEIMPGYAQAHNNLGNALMQKGRVDEAISHFRAALQINPNYEKAYINLNRALQQKGDKD